MRISFDVDDTIICYQDQVPREPVQIPWLLRGWFTEPLRAGTPALMKQLVKEGWEIAIYTTSYRTPSYMKWFLWFHGVRVKLVVNQDLHDRVVNGGGRPRGPSKLPSRFNIDLHVDDSEGVAMEGKQHGFNVVVVRPDDLNWAQAVLDAARRFRRI